MSRVVHDLNPQVHFLSPYVFVSISMSASGSSSLFRQVCVWVFFFCSSLSVLQGPFPDVCHVSVSM